MSAVLDLKAIGSRVRASRQARGFKSLEKFADRIAELGDVRPSGAKLSRIESGIQPVTPDILSPLAQITDIPAVELRPDLAAALRQTQEGAAE